MEFEFSKGGDSVPVGTYKAKLDRVEEREKNEHGNSVRFVWKVVGGEQDDREATRIVGIDRPPTAKSALGRVLSGLAGGSFEVGQKIRVEDYVGRFFLLQVQDAPGGNGTRVETVFPVPE
jgi:hypothetical protein